MKSVTCAVTQCLQITKKVTFQKYLNFPAKIQISWKLSCETFLGIFKHCTVYRKTRFCGFLLTSET